MGAGFSRQPAAQQGTQPTVPAATVPAAPAQQGTHPTLPLKPPANATTSPSASMQTASNPHQSGGRRRKSKRVHWTHKTKRKRKSKRSIRR